MTLSIAYVPTEVLGALASMVSFHYCFVNEAVITTSALQKLKPRLRKATYRLIIISFHVTVKENRAE